MQIYSDISYVIVDVMVILDIHAIENAQYCYNKSCNNDRQFIFF